MTDLLNRPTTTTTSERPSGRLSGRLSGVARLLSGGGSGVLGEPVGRPLTVSAAMAAVGAAGTTMAACMVVAVVGWFLADAGAHGETTDALRVGADSWLVGHGSRLTVSGVPLGIVPLALTLLIATVLFRFGRRAGLTSQPVEDDWT